MPTPDPPVPSRTGATSRLGAGVLSGMFGASGMLSGRGDQVASSILAVKSPVWLASAATLPSKWPILTIPVK